MPLLVSASAVEDQRKAKCVRQFYQRGWNSDELLPYGFFVFRLRLSSYGWSWKWLWLQKLKEKKMRL